MKEIKRLPLKVALAVTISFAIIFSMATTGYSKGKLHAPDGRTIAIKGGTVQPDMSRYRSPVESKILDRRFYTSEAAFLANEGYNFGQVGFNDMVKAGIPLAYKTEFQWAVHQETYWYARYLLQWMGASSHLGISMVQGPYWTLKALEYSKKNKLNRDRAERILSNKDILLGFYLPLYYKIVGFPRVFDDASATYLQYASGDPRLEGPVIIEDNYEDTQSDKKGNWGVPAYYMDWLNLRWNHDEMDTTFDMGAIGQLLKRRTQWGGYFFHSDHTGQSPSNPCVKITLKGNDAEEGFRGIALITAATNTMLEAKSAMFADVSGKLGGINPYKYDPSNGLRYLPHQIEPNILWVGDLPERLWSMDIKDSSSQLWDQASWIWATTEQTNFVQRYSDKIYTDNPPVDGGILEKSVGQLSRGLANVLVKNLEAMHLKNGILVSEWTPEGGTGDTISMRDAAMTVVALKEYHDRHEALDKDEKLREKALSMLTSLADFLVKVQGADGSFYETYSVSGKSGIGGNALSAPNWAGIRVLIAAWHKTEDEKYMESARKTFNLLNEKYWVETYGVYRTRLKDDTVILTPYKVGIALSAMREMIFATPLHLVEPQLERFTRWWVQTMDMSGMQQSEDYRTGELAYGVIGMDEDADGIPFVSGGYGDHGTAPVAAGKVAINIGGSGNGGYASLEGDAHDPGKFAKIKYGYKFKSAGEQSEIILPIKISGEGLVERPPMQRFDGTIIPLPASKHVERGLGIKLGLSGKEIFEMNCAPCHGYNGEGITGMSFERDALSFSHKEMFKVPMFGRHDKLMPPWGIGNDDGFGGPLTEKEIHMIVDYVQSDGFKKNYKQAKKGMVVSGAPPKGVYGYISKRMNKDSSPATIEDIRRIAESQPKASEYVFASSERFHTLLAKMKEKLKLANRRKSPSMTNDVQKMDGIKDARFVE